MRRLNSVEQKIHEKLEGLKDHLQIKVDHKISIQITLAQSKLTVQSKTTYLT